MKQLFVLLFITSFSSAFSQDREIFKVVENMPVFPGCEIGDNQENQICTKQKLNQYIDDNLIYPDSAMIMGIEGKVFVQFVITAEGTISDVKAVRDLGYGCGNAVVKTLQGMNDFSPKWTPGRQRTRNVDVLYTLPVEFKLPKSYVEKVYRDVENKPYLFECAHLLGQHEIEDCHNNILAKFFKRATYPAQARQNSVEGVVIIGFVIDKNGNMKDFTVVKGIGSGCDESALDAVKHLTKSNLTWIPAKQNGKNVNYLYEIPVKFFLDDQNKKKKR